MFRRIRRCWSAAEPRFIGLQAVDMEPDRLANFVLQARLLRDPLASLIRSPLGSGPYLQPLLPLEKQVGPYRREQHRDKRVGITVDPLEFRHDLEIHAVDRG